MYDSGSITNIRTVEGEIRVFSIAIGQPQGSSLSPYLFTLAMDELAKHTQNQILWCMFFTDDVILR